MRPGRVLVGVAALLVSALADVSAGGENERREVIADFLDFHCIDCHDQATEKGEREFESLSFPLASVQDLITAQEIVDQVTLKEMPPDEEDQPEDEERLALVRALRGEIAAARGRLESTGGRTVMRRLSNREYENTLEALFGRRVDTLGLTADFPQENTSRHLDTIGDSLVTSGFLLDHYFESAQRLVETRLAKPATEPRSWRFDGNFKQYEELSGPHREVFDYRYLCLYEQPDSETRQGGYAHIEDFLEGVPVSGLYDIRVRAAALHRDTHYDPEIFRIDFSEPFLLAVVTGDVRAGHIHYPQPIEPWLAEPLVVPDEEPEWLEFRVWLEAGQTPRFIFPNGPYESRRSVIQLNKRYREEFENPESGVRRGTLLREGKLPHIRISEIEIRGPLPEAGGSAEERAVFGEDGFVPDRALEQLEVFAARAFRRPLNEADRERIRALYEKRRREGAEPRRAALDALKLILCSPSFLYLAEVTPEDDPRLRAQDLAARLSYALWAGPPDERLREAAAGRLDEEEGLRAEIARMLDDERVEGFVAAFLGAWLNLRDLGNFPPPRNKEEAYYAEALPVSMKTEARTFFAHLLREDGPVSELLDADYGFVDKKLARLYDLPEKDTLRLADGFVRVDLSDEPARGGVLGMAGVLAVSANGVETSPVTRGVFVSENILGVIPPPPPDEVPAIEPDVRGATSIRDKLEKHRANKTCAECHRKIDPLGFPLESFDPVGRWRDRYPKAGKKAVALPVDPSSELPSGETFADFEGFKKVLVETRSEVFVRHLIGKVLAHATGRHMEAGDRFEIEDIQRRVAARGGGLRTLVVECLSSELFRSR